MNQEAYNISKAESPRERIERLVREGKIARDTVTSAESIWRERLREGVKLPNGEVVKITIDDLYTKKAGEVLWRQSEQQ